MNTIGKNIAKSIELNSMCLYCLDFTADNICEGCYPRNKSLVVLAHLLIWL